MQSWPAEAHRTRETRGNCRSQFDEKSDSNVNRSSRKRWRCSLIWIEWLIFFSFTRKISKRHSYKPRKNSITPRAVTWSRPLNWVIIWPISNVVFAKNKCVWQPTSINRRSKEGEDITGSMFRWVSLEFHCCTWWRRTWSQSMWNRCSPKALIL